MSGPGCSGIAKRYLDSVSFLLESRLFRRSLSGVIPAGCVSYCQHDSSYYECQFLYSFKRPSVGYYLGLSARLGLADTSSVQAGECVDGIFP